MNEIIYYFEKYIGSYFAGYEHVFLMVGILQLILSRYNISKFIGIITPVIVSLYEIFYKDFTSEDIILMFSLLLFATNILAYFNEFKSNIFYSFSSILFGAVLSIYFTETIDELYLNMTIILACVVAFMIMISRSDRLTNIMPNIIIYVLAIAIVSGYTVYVSIYNRTLSITNLIEENIGISEYLLFISICIYIGIWPFSFLITWQNHIISSVATIITPMQIGIFSYILIKIFNHNEILFYAGTIMIIYGVIYGLLTCHVRDCFIRISMIQFGYIIGISSIMDISSYVSNFIFMQSSAYLLISVLKRKYSINYFTDFNEDHPIDLLKYILILSSMFIFLIFPTITLCKIIFITNFLDDLNIFSKIIYLSSLIMTFSIIPWKIIFNLKIEYKFNFNLVIIAEILVMLIMGFRSSLLVYNNFIFNLIDEYILFTILGIYLSYSLDFLNKNYVILDVNWFYRNKYWKYLFCLVFDLFSKLNIRRVISIPSVSVPINLSYATAIIFLIMIIMLKI